MPPFPSQPQGSLVAVCSPSRLAPSRGHCPKGNTPPPQPPPCSGPVILPSRALLSRWRGGMGPLQLPALRFSPAARRGGSAGVGGALGGVWDGWFKHRCSAGQAVAPAPGARLPLWSGIPDQWVGLTGASRAGRGNQPKRGAIGTQQGLGMLMALSASRGRVGQVLGAEEGEPQRCWPRSGG